MLSILLFTALAIAPQPDPFAPLAAYNGSWRIHSSNGTDTLVNHCTHGRAFYSCEQIINGKPAALVVFTISSEAGKFDVDKIFPNGHASSDTDLFIHGDHWTFITNSAPNTPRYRIENNFHGPNAIHFEQFETTDAGKTWTKTDEGDESRLRP